VRDQSASAATFGAPVRMSGRYSQLTWTAPIAAASMNTGFWRHDDARSSVVMITALDTSHG